MFLLLPFVVCLAFSFVSSLNFIIFFFRHLFHALVLDGERSRGWIGGGGGGPGLRGGDGWLFGGVVL